MKVAFVALGFPPQVGGTERYNVEYARRLQARGHEVKVFTWGDEDAGDAALPFEVRRAPYERENKQILPGDLAQALAEWQSDVAFVSRGSRALPRVVEVVAKAHPMVLSIHELREKHRNRGVIGRWRIRRRYGLDRAKVITVNSADTRSRMVDLGIPEERLVTVSPGVDLARFTPQPEVGAALRAERGWGERPVLLTVARLAANKGHKLVIEALPALLKQSPELLYVIVGQGGMQAELEARARELGVSEQVLFTGLVDDVVPYYQACDVFVMPSAPQSEGANAGEGFGIAYVEAGACGKAVLASSSGGGAEIVVDGETGRVVDPRQPNQLQAALSDLLEAAERRAQMGAAGRERVQRYDWERGCDALERALWTASGKRPSETT